LGIFDYKKLHDVQITQLFIECTMLPFLHIIRPTLMKSCYLADLMFM